MMINLHGEEKMTREEALNKYPHGWMEDGSYNDYPKDEIVNKIYDDFEARTCENCSCYKFVPIFDENTREWCCTEPTVVRFVSLPPKEYGCNKWRTK